jgi:hypothetical protein
VMVTVSCVHRYGSMPSKLFYGVEYGIISQKGGNALRATD